MLNVSPEERKKRAENKELQFIWRPAFEHLGLKSDVFTHIIHDYNVEPLALHILDAESSERRAGASYFKDYVRNMSAHYNSNQLLIMVGSGLNFEKAELYFRQIENMITHFNSHHDDVTILFSTLSHYDLAMAAHKDDLPITYNDSNLIQ